MELLANIKLIFMVLGLASLFGGVPAALLAVILCIFAPERRPKVWPLLLAVFAVWFAGSLCYGVVVCRRIAFAEGMEGLAVLSMNFPILFANLIPSLFALFVLVRRRPGTSSCAEVVAGP